MRADHNGWSFRIQPFEAADQIPERIDPGFHAGLFHPNSHNVDRFTILFGKSKPADARFADFSDLGKPLNSPHHSVRINGKLVHAYPLPKQCNS
jgi:hypothetical protein